MVVGPVVLTDNNLFEKFQQLEFASVNGVSAAALALKKPNTCSGANIGYRKERFMNWEDLKVMSISPLAMMSL